MYTITEDEKKKVLESKKYNYTFDKNTGLFIRYGETVDDDPQYSPYGPEIVDIEITTICNGPGGKLCDFCYKSNTRNGSYMSFETYKKVFSKLPNTVTQIAFGVDASCTTNPDTERIFKYTRDNGIIPNVTVADVTPETAKMISKYCGAVAVSLYDNTKDMCYDCVKMFTDLGMDQVNIHICIHNNNFDLVKEVVGDIIFKRDERISKLHAIVFLSLKKKGRGKSHELLPQDKFSEIVDVCFEYGVKFGFDSCSAVKVKKAIRGYEHESSILESIEECESSRFSAYINVNGEFFPCSFIENTDKWRNGIDVIACNSFLDDVWFNKKTVQFRNNCIKCNDKNIACQVYDI